MHETYEKNLDIRSIKHNEVNFEVNLKVFQLLEYMLISITTDCAGHLGRCVSGDVSIDHKSSYRGLN